MNAEVEIHVGQRDSVLAVPNASLRTQRDVGVARPRCSGIDPASVTAQLAAERQRRRPACRTARRAARSQAVVAPKDSGADEGRRRPATP